MDFEKFDDKTLLTQGHDMHPCESNIAWIDIRP